MYYTGILKSIHDNVEELHKTYDNTLTIIANAAELRDAVTGSHIERVNTTVSRLVKNWVTQTAIWYT